MPRAATTIDEQDLERALLRKSVGSLTGESPRCSDCGRTPLIGETLYRFAAALPVCELCRPLRREAPEGREHVRRSRRGAPVPRGLASAPRPSGSGDAPGARSLAPSPPVPTNR